MKALLLLALVSCGGQISPAPVPAQDAGQDVLVEAAPEASPPPDEEDAYPSPESHACPPWCKVGNQPPNRNQ